MREKKFTWEKKIEKNTERFKKNIYVREKYRKENTKGFKYPKKSFVKKSG